MARHAILVGVNSYEGNASLPDLRFAEADASELATVLEKQGGFETKLFTGDKATRDNIESQIYEDRDGDTLLFYFAGHGGLSVGRYLLFPRDGQITGHRALDFKVLANYWHNNTKYKQVLLILDSCREEMQVTRGGTGLDLESSVIIRSAIQGDGWVEVIYGCGEGESSHEFPELGHGLFTDSLLKAIYTNGGELTSDTWAGIAGDIMKAWCEGRPRNLRQRCYRYAPASKKENLVILPAKTPSGSEIQTPSTSQPIQSVVDPRSDISFTLNTPGSMKRGARQLLRCIRTVIGPAARPFGLLVRGEPISTKCGERLLDYFRFDNPGENLALQFIREASIRTTEASGTGASTTAIIAGNLFLKGLALIVDGKSPLHVQEEIRRTIDLLVPLIQSMATPLQGADQTKCVATTAAKHNTCIGQLILDACSTIGKHGMVIIEESGRDDTAIEFTAGLSLATGYLSPHFSPDQYEQELNEPLILVHNGRIGPQLELSPILNRVVEANRPLLIVSTDISEEALDLLVLNHKRGVIELCAIKPPAFGRFRSDLLKDVAVFTGATVSGTAVGPSLPNVMVSHLGSARTVKITSDTTSIVDGKGSPDAMESYLDQLTQECGRSRNAYDQEKIKERIASLSGGLVRIHVGGESANDVKERKLQVENALLAVRTAASGGVVIGGGFAFRQIASKLKSRPVSVDPDVLQIVLESIVEPSRAIIENTGCDVATCIEEIEKNPDFTGFNAVTRQPSDLESDGLFDPADAIIAALVNAGTAASLLIDQETKATC